MNNDPTFTGFNGFAAQEDDFLPVPGELSMDADRYRKEMAELDLTDDQVNELLAILWDIMRRFVELGISTEICGSIFEAVFESSVSESGDGSLRSSSNMEPPSKDNGKDSA
uniref:hypothetical protein n=1 Tax=Stappia sp. TaxID=1870903 RepID=UPI003BA9BFE8